jgi:translation initiation factor 3 subunit G
MSAAVESPSLSKGESLPANIKIVEEEKIDENGRRIKVIRRIRLRLVTETISPGCIARRAWRKFGDAAKDEDGPQPSSTVTGEAVFLKLSLTKGAEEEPTKMGVVQAKNVTCRYCQGAHWSARCPYKSTFADDLAAEKKDSAEPAKLKYIPPSQRRAQEPGAPATTTATQTNPNTIRISNLFETVTEDDLRYLVSFIAEPARVFVVRDRRTGVCKGSAFVSFYTPDHCDRAIEKLNGHRFGHSVLAVEKAKPQV